MSSQFPRQSQSAVTSTVNFMIWQNSFASAGPVQTPTISLWGITSIGVIIPWKLSLCWWLSKSATEIVLQFYAVIMKVGKLHKCKCAVRNVSLFLDGFSFYPNAFVLSPFSLYVDWLID
jgi:hypothetical protein